MHDQYTVPGLAVVTIDTDDQNEPLLRITLQAGYISDINDLPPDAAELVHYERNNDLPKGIYLECNSTSSINNPLLAKFMEVLAHWDYDGDGAFDGDEVADAIEEAMWRSRDKPNEFRRPSGGWYTGTLMRLMPPAPVRHIVFSFGELRPRFRKKDYLVSIPTIAVVFALVQAQIYLFPVMKYNVITGGLALCRLVGLHDWMVWVLIVLLILLRRKKPATQAGTHFSPHTYGFFNRAAVYEEQAFREGAEHWNFRQRATSCLVFGAIHMTNLIYPLATILPLSLGGAVFMSVYLRVFRRTKFRRSAVLASAVVHRVYNRIALISVVASLVVILGVYALSLFGLYAMVVLGTLYKERKFQSTAPAPNKVPAWR